MKHEEIKNRIDYLFKLVEEKTTLETFQLNNEVYSYIKEIEELQKKCTHNFINGICEYCKKEENHE